MPWHQTNPMDQKTEFVLKALAGGNFRLLCRDHGISAKTGYKWKERFMARGLEGLGEHSRRPHSSPEALGEVEACAIILLKQRHPHWGPLKLQELYARSHGHEQTPGLSSFKRVLERAGMVQKKRVRAAPPPGGRLHSGRQGRSPNEVWTVDFKGWWHDPQGGRCEPLTVRDEHSRYVLECHRMEDARTESVWKRLERLFERHGLPQAIRSDNGAPFASRSGVLGLSRLSARWVALGIELERSRPGCPQDNGAHERMHRDISKELERSPQGWTQAALDTWREEFNHQRPHQNLGMKMPGEIYHNSTQRYEGLPQELSYEALGAAAVAQRKIGPRGQLCWEHQQIFISNALAGWNVALCPVQDQDGLLDLYFASLLLGQVEPATHSFLRAPRGPKEAGVIPSDA